MRAGLGTIRELNLAVGQLLSLFACLSPDLHSDYSNEIELKVLGKYTVHRLGFIAQITLPKGSGSKAKVQHLRKSIYTGVSVLCPLPRGR